MADNVESSMSTSSPGGLNFLGSSVHPVSSRDDLTDCITALLSARMSPDSSSRGSHAADGFGGGSGGGGNYGGDCELPPPISTSVCIHACLYSCLKIFSDSFVRSALYALRVRILCLPDVRLLAGLQTRAAVPVVVATVTRTAFERRGPQ